MDVFPRAFKINIPHSGNFAAEGKVSPACCRVLEPLRLLLSRCVL